MMLRIALVSNSAHLDQCQCCYIMFLITVFLKWTILSSLLILIADINICFCFCFLVFYRVYEIAGCILVAIVGILIDLPIITVIVIYKVPIMLVKGWHRLIQDLIGREGPFLETVCVPFAGLWIILWPVVVLLAAFSGITSSIGYGCYAAVVAYQVCNIHMLFWL